MPHGEVSITLQDVKVLLGLPVDGDPIIGSTQKTWTEVCREFLGFQPINQDQHKQLDGQRILISRLLEQVAGPLPTNAEEDVMHKCARCYILALLGDTIFADKSGDRVQLMWVQQFEDLCNPHMYSWGSACLAWLYRELCRASDRGTNQISGCLLLVQYWAWARFPYLCPAVEHGPPVGAYGPPVRAPLALKWLWVPNKKNRPAHIFRDKYREQLASMLPGQVVWQPYEAEFDDLPPWCVAGRAVWTATVPLVCFHIIEKHTPDRVVCQFGMIQDIPHFVDTDTVLHKIDLRGKVGVNWMRRHAVHIVHWRNRLQRRFEVVLGEMPPHHEYFGWFNRVTRRFIHKPGAKLTMLVSLVNRLSRHHPVGTEEHEDITHVLTAVHHIDRVQPPIPEATNEEAATPVGPSTTEGPSTSTTPTGCASRSLVATPQIVPTPDSSPYTPHASPSFTIPAFTSHPSPTLTIPSSTHPPPSLTIPPFTSHPSPTLTIPSSTHPSPSLTIPAFTSHPSPSPTIPHPSPSPTIPPPMLAPPSLHPRHILVMGLTFVHPSHSHFLSCHPFHPLTRVFIQPHLRCSRSHPPTVRLLPLLQPSTHPIFSLSSLLGYLQWQKVGRNAYQSHLLVGQGGTNTDTRLGPRHLTKSMQDLLLVIRDNLRSKKDDDAKKRLEVATK